MKHLSKLLVAPIFLFVLFSFSACTKEDLKLTAEITLSNFEVPAISTQDDWAQFTGTQVLTGIKKKITDNGGDPAMLKSVKITGMNLTINSGQNFDKILYVEGHINTEPNKVAYKVDIPATGLTTIDLDLQYNELIDYFKEDQIKVIIKGFNLDPLPAMTCTSVIKVELVVGQ